MLRPIFLILMFLLFAATSVFAQDTSLGTPHTLVGNLYISLQDGPCIRIVKPHEWQRIPCSKTDLTCVPIWAEQSDTCDTQVSQVEFRWAPTPDGPWYFIEEVIDTAADGYWKTCWNNHEEIYIDSILHDGDEVYFIAIGYDMNHVVDTSEMVKVFLDCYAPEVELIIEDIIYACGIPKVSGEITLKANFLGDTLDVTDVIFWYKLYSDPDLFSFWDTLCVGEPGWYENIYMCTYNTVELNNNTWYDVRISVVDDAGNMWQDYDEDGTFDDFTFLAAVEAGAGDSFFVDSEAPQPAFSMVADSACSLFYVNPSLWLGGNGKARVRALDSITLEISVLPSEDTCEVKKVEYFLGILDTLGYAVRADAGWEYEYYSYYDTIYDWEEVDTTWYHVGTGTEPNHWPFAFNPWDLPEIIPHSEFEDGWWQGALKAVLYDSLENSKEDVIELYILDAEPYQAVIIDPRNDCCICGDVHMRVVALNPYEISEVTYQHRHQDSTDWTDILNGTSTEPDSFPIIWQIADIPSGPYGLRAVAKDFTGIPDSVPPTIGVWVYVSGDANGDEVIDIDDVVYLINYLFVNGTAPVTCLEAGDANCDGEVDIADAMYLINYLFIGGPPPTC